MQNNVNKNEYPRVLLISHNIFSKTSNMGKTLYNMFSEWPKESIAQLYFHSEVPTTRLCEKYFRITDFEVLKSLYKKNEIGTIFEKDQIDTELENSRIDKDVQANIYQFGRKRKSYMYLGRNLIWNFNTWNNNKLDKWIDNFNPDVIFFASGDYVFSNRIAMSIAKKRNIPIITYICDDFYLNKEQSPSPLYYMKQNQFKKSFKKLMKTTSNCIYICDKMNKDYTSTFNNNGITLMTTSSLNKQDITRNSDISISYIGNLGLDRWKPLVEIGTTLKNNFNKNIDVYSYESRKNILKHLNESNGIKFHGGIGSDKVESVINNSDILIHVENNDEFTNKRIKYSISTKIADSLASGKCIFAYGPKDVASIEYLKENEVACVVTNKDELESSLRKILESEELRKYYSENGLKLAGERHNMKKNSQKLKNLINKTVIEFG